VAVFSAAGKHLGDIAVELPACVEVHPKTGAVYVLGGATYTDLAKFASYKAAKPAATAKLPYYKNRHFRATMALDASGDKPVLWFGCLLRAYGLLRMEDNGRTLGKPRDVIPHPKKPTGVGRVFDVSYHQPTDTLLIMTDKAFASRHRTVANASTNTAFKDARLKLGGVGYLGPGSIGRDGLTYRFLYHSHLGRYDLAGKHLPFTGDNSERGYLRPPNPSSWRTRPRGVTADAEGDIYLLQQMGASPTKGPAGEPNAVMVYSPDGKLKHDRLIDTDFRCVSSPRIDPAGNVYLIVGIRPGDAQLPPGLEGKVPTGRKDPHAVGGINGYPMAYGSIVKFPPKGGKIKFDAEGLACNYAFGKRIHVSGAEWVHSGASPAASWRTKGTVDICLCESARFDVDGFGRSFYPDAMRFRVGICDTRGNSLGTFGAYGNADATCEEGAVPLLWPYGVAVGDRCIFVADRLNRRVVRVRIAYDADKMVEMK